MEKGKIYQEKRTVDIITKRSEETTCPHCNEPFKIIYEENARGFSIHYSAKERKPKH